MIKHFAATLLTLVIVLWLGGYIFFVLMTGIAKPIDRTTKTDAIVVLTGGNFRVHTGLKLFVEGMAPELFITGVYKQVTESEIRALWRENSTLPACCITLGQEAKTTLENAREAKEWLKKKQFKKIRLVTSTYHLQRALLEFQYEIPSVEIIPHPVEEEDYSLHEWKFWTITFSEYNKYIVRSIIVTFLRGY